MIELKGTKKIYRLEGEPAFTLGVINLTFSDVGFVAILGPSGCGKTTLLNVIGGLDHYEEGDLLVNGASTKQYKDKDWDTYRNAHIGFVFQNYNLISHYSVIRNVEVPLMLHGLKKEEQKQKALNALKLVGLEEEAYKQPNELSGGQMQRVAIARALVNDPSVILADEPTGALDSKTSVQVMDLLKEIAKTHLVVVVTHNAELAKTYADRIIEMKDGKIISDTSPVDCKIPANPTQKIQKHTSMSFFASLQSSLGSLANKRARTCLTIIASCFGVVGVAFVLAIAEGFSFYVARVESSIASTMPIAISKTQYSQVGEDNITPDPFPDTDKMYIYNGNIYTYVSHSNNLNNREYAENVLDPLVEDGLARSVLYNREGLSFNVVTELGVEAGSGIYKVIDQYKDATLGASLVSALSAVPSTVFHELYGEKEGLEGMYDLIYGKYPESMNEVVLITDEYNRIDVQTLVDLGFYSSKEDAPKSLSFEEIISTSTFEGKTFKAFPNSTLYKEKTTLNVPAYEVTQVSLIEGMQTGEFVKGRKVIKEITLYENPLTQDLASLYEKDDKDAIELKIVGVIRPSEESFVSLMPSSIGYLSSLTDYFVNDSLSEGAKGIKESSTTSWFIPEENGGRDGLEVLNEKMNQVVEELRGVTEEETDLNSLKISLAITLQNSLKDVATSFCWAYFDSYNLKNNTYTYSYSHTPFLEKARQIGADFREQEVASEIEKLQREENLTFTTIVTYLTKFFNPSFFSSTANGIRFVDFLAYVDSYSNVTSILIFPTSLTTKAEIFSRLDSYNEGKEGNEQILYSDLMGDFTSSITTLVDLISMVLVVFASLSLMVSAIMMAIITYVSVLERTKEIGVLRACGARKKDVGRLFEVECLVVGAISGVLGIAISALMCVPTNRILNLIFVGERLGNIAMLTWYVSLAMVVLSTILSWASGLIPSRIAAKKDPVNALRSD